MTTPVDAKEKFEARAKEYDQQSRIALAGYEACHELTACMLSSTIERATDVKILVGGAGTAQEVLSIGALQPAWRFTAVDPSPTMMELANGRLSATGLLDRVDSRVGYVEELPQDELYDGATLIGVLHHLSGEEAKNAILSSIAIRLKAGAPFVLACNRYNYASRPVLLNAWKQRWRMHGSSDKEVEEKLAKILHGAEPPSSDEAVVDYLKKAGFKDAIPFFSSLFWCAWISYRA